MEKWHCKKQKKLNFRLLNYSCFNMNVIANIFYCYLLYHIHLDKAHFHSQHNFFFFWKTKATFICSYLAFEVLLMTSLAWDSLLYIALNHHTTSTNHFTGFPSLSILQRPTHSFSFLLSSSLIRLVWCSAHRASTNLIHIDSSQLGASTQRWAWHSLRLRQLPEFHVPGRRGWERSSAPLI